MYNNRINKHADNVNEADFIAIIKDHQKLIYKICHSYCPNPDNHKDLEQEILLQLWQSFKRFDGRVKLSTWIYKVALNTAISFYKKDKKQQRPSMDINEQIIQLDNSVQEEQNEKINLLYQFINQLNEMDKAVILLYLDQHKHHEIASIIGISTTNVATKIGRIKKKLQQAFLQTQNH